MLAVQRERPPRERATESEFDEVVLASFEQMRIDDPEVRNWLEEVIRAKSQSEVNQNRKDREDVRYELNRAQKERDTLLDMMLKGHLDADMYKRKDQELGSLVTHLKVSVEGREREQSEIGDLALKLLGLSQTLKNKWLVADTAEKRVLLEIVHSDFTFKDATLIITKRKPFDMFVKGPLLEYGTGETTQIGLFWDGIREFPTQLLPFFTIILRIGCHR